MSEKRGQELKQQFEVRSSERFLFFGKVPPLELFGDDWILTGTLIAAVGTHRVPAKVPGSWRKLLKRFLADREILRAGNVYTLLSPAEAESRGGEDGDTERDTERQRSSGPPTDTDSDATAEATEDLWCRKKTRLEKT
ncbi:unnamed protein product [Pleuronectes platessa]|uniref:Uncharacterized protein n=1 Tax=Pleuronectes platessa TaxID=8262 RepID=A0A9N7TGC4_PLEPL|nr:unnamed protein product [Pleuronectes platessa]